MKQNANSAKGNTSLAYFKAVGANEIKWTREYANHKQFPYSTTDELESSESYLLLLEQYSKITPYLVPQPASVDIHSPTLWHPDFHRDNLFVDPDTNKITQIIDWQSAVIAPLFLQSGVPRMLKHSKPVEEDWSVPEQPDNYNDLSEEEKSKVNSDIEGLTYHKYYKYQRLKKNPRHWACLEIQRLLDLQTNPVKLVTKSWENSNVFYFRDALMALIREWDTLKVGVACPISFSEEAYRVHAKEEENINAIGEILRIFRDENLLPVDGMVNHEDYERAQKNCLEFKEMFVGLASTAEEKRLHERLWPYQDS
jgi:hypothetical protein